MTRRPAERPVIVAQPPGVRLGVRESPGTVAGTSN